MTKFSYESMGTHWEISLQDGCHLVDLAAIEKEIKEMSADFDTTYSRFIKTSLVWKIAEKAGTYKVPDDFINMLRLYIELYASSNRKLNPLIGFTISDLGYDDQYSLKEKEIIRPAPDLLETVRIVQDGHHLAIRTSQPVLFDFGALGKGYFVDKIASYLKSKGIKTFTVNGSGDIYYSGSEPIKVGLEHPDDSSLVIGTIEMNQGAMCASGINRRRWREYHHVIDPHTNTSTDETIKATWVIAENATLADALATCLFFVSPESLASYSFDYVMMNSIGTIKKSPRWKGDFF
jgi:thiamine biosynthesis lipoprotein